MISGSKRATAPAVPLERVIAGMNGFSAKKLIRSNALKPVISRDNLHKPATGCLASSFAGAVEDRKEEGQTNFRQVVAFMLFTFWFGQSARLKLLLCTEQMC